MSTTPKLTPDQRSAARSALATQLKLEPSVKNRLAAILIRLDTQREASARWASWLAPASLLLGWAGSVWYIWRVYSGAFSNPFPPTRSLLAAPVPALLLAIWWVHQRYRIGSLPKLPLVSLFWTVVSGSILIVVAIVTFYIGARNWVTELFSTAALAAFILPYALIPPWVYTVLRTSFSSFWVGRRDPEATVVSAFHDFTELLAVTKADRADLVVQEQLARSLAEATAAMSGTLPRILYYDPPAVRRQKRQESEATVRTLRNAQGCLPPDKASDLDLSSAGRSALVAAVESRWSEIAGISFGCEEPKDTPALWRRRLRTLISAAGIALGWIALVYPDVIDKATSISLIGGQLFRGALYLVGLTSIVAVFSSDGPGSRAGRRALAWMANLRAAPASGPPPTA